MQTGGSPILSYIVSWDSGNGGAFTTLSGWDVNNLETTKLYVVNVDSGVYYQFKYKVRNVHGEGQDSLAVTVLAGTVPHQMN